MRIEHKVLLLSPTSTPKAWQEHLDEHAAGGWRFVQCVDRVDGWLLIFIRARP